VSRPANANRCRQAMPTHRDAVGVTLRPTKHGALFEGVCSIGPCRLPTKGCVANLLTESPISSGQVAPGTALLVGQQTWRSNIHSALKICSCIRRHAGPIRLFHIGGPDDTQTHTLRRIAHHCRTCHRVPRRWWKWSDAACAACPSETRSSEACSSETNDSWYETKANAEEA